MKIQIVLALECVVSHHKIQYQSSIIKPHHKDPKAMDTNARSTLPVARSCYLYTNVLLWMERQRWNYIILV